MTHTRLARRGFTVVEILIVIGIIILLAAIFLPVFAAVKRKGQATSCMSNLKQLGLAFQNYTQDYGRRYPFAGEVQNWSPGNGHWVSGTANAFLANLSWPYSATGEQADVEDGALFTYTKSASVYVCPANADGQKKRLTYSMNCAISGISDARIRQPSDIVLLVDEDTANDGYFFAVDDTHAHSAGTNSTDALTRLHNDGGNLLFCDAHVKFYAFKTFVLDDSQTGKTNKWKETGSPRFHDAAFGTWGSNIRLGATQDYCNATDRDAGT
jgi:prepilin-type processing-associated H-X9-DG protein